MAPDAIISAHLDKLKDDPNKRAAYIFHILENAGDMKVSEDMQVTLCDQLRQLYQGSKPPKRNVEKLVSFYNNIAEKTTHEDIRRSAGTSIEMLCPLTPDGRESTRKFYEGLAVKTGSDFYRAKTQHYTPKREMHLGAVAGILIMMIGVFVFTKSFTGYVISNTSQVTFVPLSISVFIAGFILTYHYSRKHN